VVNKKRPSAADGAKQDMDMVQDMNIDPPDPVSISSLNDFLYCNRRCALHRLDALWVDNAWTVSGTLAHEHADDPGYRQTAEGARIERALPLFSVALGLVGKADIVEFWPGVDGREIPLPVDYKLGKRKKWDNDDVQLCAQALCLEEMVGVPVPKGAIYHVKTRRRREVVFTDELRELTVGTIDNVRALILADVVPPAILKPQCEGCSMHAICVPELAGGSRLVDTAYAELFALRFNE
jgi:CRISPR-associated exonuclease Cas4